MILDRVYATPAPFTRVSAAPGVRWAVSVFDDPFPGKNLGLTGVFGVFRKCSISENGAQTPLKLAGPENTRQTPETSTGWTDSPLLVRSYDPEQTTARLRAWERPSTGATGEHP